MSTTKPNKKFMKLSDFLYLISRHKVATALTLLLVVLVCSIASYNYLLYAQKFSRSDYDQLTSMAGSVLKTSGGTDIQVSRTCSYERPGEFSNLHLYCTIHEIAYMPYDSDEHAVRIAKNFEEAIQQEFGQIDFPISNFYEKPHNGTDTAAVELKRPLPQEQCIFHISANNNARHILGFPDRSENNLIALWFECSAESRAEYFPVTYRQG